MVEEDDDELPYGVAPPGKVMSAGQGRIGNTIVRLQEAYESWMSNRKGTAHKISDSNKANKVWERMANEVVEIGAYPEDWIRAQFTMNAAKTPYATNMVGKEAEARYRHMLSVMYDEGKQPEPDMVCSVAEKEFDIRLDYDRKFMVSRAGTADLDSIAVMFEVDECTSGMDALYMLLECNTSMDMYLPIFSANAAADLRNNPDLMNLCNKRYPGKVAAILNYADKHREDN